jgi:hypothetical protein
VALSAPVAFEPAVATVPDQPPEALQEVALVDDQVRVELAPLAILAGLALMETLGAGAETVTVTDCAAEPPVPVQVSVNLVVAVRAAVVLDPLIASPPLQPPDAVQAVALVDDQVNVDVAPLLTVVGLADRVTAGAGLVTETVADWLALPPVPVHVSP